MSKSLIRGTSSHQKPREIFFKVCDLFNREFNWPSQLLKFPRKRKLNFSFDYKSPFEENLRSLKKIFHLNDDECNRLKFHYSLAFLIHQLENTKYEDKKLLNKVYRADFNQDNNKYFIEIVEYIIKKIEKFDEVFDVARDGQRVLVNILLGISFEYACKALLLSRNYIINEYGNNENTPIKKEKLKKKLIKSRTISIDKIWTFIRSRYRIIKLDKDQKIIGNYLVFLRNVQSHTPILMASRGTYNKKCMALIKKIIGGATQNGKARR